MKTILANGNNGLKVKSCTIYKTKNHYKIITNSITDAGYLNTFPVFVLDINCTNNELEIAIFKSLANSNSSRALKREEYALNAKKVIEGIHEKSYTSLHRKSTSCSITLHNKHRLVIRPYQFYKSDSPRQGLKERQGEQVEIVSAYEHKADVVNAILELFNKFPDHF